MVCDLLLLEINTGVGKTEVVSSTDHIWDIFSDDIMELSLRQVLEYSFLGLDTSASILRTTVSKQSKCLRIAKKYKFACLHIGKSSPYKVDAALASWNQVAIPSMLYGCESIVLSWDCPQTLQTFVLSLNLEFFHSDSPYIELS